MAIWEFDHLLTEDLERIIEIQDELFDMGLDIFDDDMMAELYGELESRKIDTEEN